MFRRHFVLGATLAALGPKRLKTQPASALKRVGVMLPYSEEDIEGHAVIAALLNGLASSGWHDGENVALDIRWSGGDPHTAAANAVELKSRSVAVIYADGNAQLIAASRVAPHIPTVFLGASSALESGLVASTSRPGGSVTGFTLFEPSLGGKWLETLKEISPNIASAGMLYNPDTASGNGEFYRSSFEAAARALGLKSSSLPVRTPEELEKRIVEAAARGDTGLVVQPDSFLISHRELIIKSTASHKIATCYPMSYFARAGGLMSYGPDKLDTCRRSASYVDRILRGENPGDLPIQAPTKYDLIINRGTANALGLAMPPALLVRADELID